MFGEKTVFMLILKVDADVDNELIANYERESSHIDMQQFTKDTFDGSFQSICNDVFTYGPVSNGWVIAILGNTQTSLLWYTIDILRNSLVNNVLEGIGFIVLYCDTFKTIFFIYTLTID